MSNSKRIPNPVGLSYGITMARRGLYNPQGTSLYSQKVSGQFSRHRGQRGTEAAQNYSAVIKTGFVQGYALIGKTQLKAGGSLRHFNATCLFERGFQGEGSRRCAYSQHFSFYLDIKHTDIVLYRCTSLFQPLLSAAPLGPWGQRFESGFYLSITNNDRPSEKI